VSPEEQPKPKRVAVIWSPEARAALRAIDRETALQILHCLDRYLLHREGDVKKLKPPRTDSVSAAATTASSLSLTAMTPSASLVSRTAVKPIAK
jgi:hypothetical protein